VAQPEAQMPIAALAKLARQGVKLFHRSFLRGVALDRSAFDESIVAVRFEQPGRPSASSA
jgi:hypothetical protein